MKLAARIALIALVWLSATQALAETCTVSGTYKLEPLDLYYCDTDQMGCGGWLQTDLDRKRDANGTAVPLRYMRVTVRTTGGTLLATAHTDANGSYAASFNSTSLAGAPALCRNQQIVLRSELTRMDERDAAAATKRYRFRLTDRNDVLTTLPRTVTFPAAGAALNGSYVQKIQRDANNQVIDQANNHYYNAYSTMDAAVSEAILWTANIRDRMTSSVTSEQEPVVMDIAWNNPAVTESSSSQRGRIWMPWSFYRAGGIMRHEFGHWVHQLVHNRQQVRGSCPDGRYPSYAPPPAPVGAQAHQVHSCEYGFMSTLEGFATFVAVRTVTSTDLNVWMCNYSGGPDDACAKDARDPATSDPLDGVNAGWQIIGDSYSDRASRCAVLDATSCGCGANCGTQAQKNRGYRVETQVARFLWDLVDTNADSNGSDDVDYSMGTLLTALQGWSCDANTLGSDNTCNEATLLGSCKLDAYNVYDISDRLEKDESQERTLNCVATSHDCTAEDPCPQD